MTGMDGKLYLRRGSAGDGAFTLAVTPERAGWAYAGLRVLTLPPGAAHTWATGDDELLVLPLAGSAVVTADGETFELQGRRDVFSRVTDFSYAPRGATVTVTSAGGGVFALPSARCTRRLPPRYGAAEDVPVELRGAGQSSRQVNNFCSPEAFECDKLIAVEVLTPGGNWSSYPPHKHDEARDGEAELEEIYYFQTSGLAYQRVYGTAARPIDVLAEVTHRRRRADPARLARPVDRRARLRPVLPQRDGRAGRRARLAVLRRSGARLGPRHLARSADRPAATPDVRGGQGGCSVSTIRLTVAQALVRFLAAQRSERDGIEQRLFAGCFGIFGHGNVAGVAQALLEAHATGPQTCGTTWPATSRPWCTPRSASPG